LHQLAYKSSEEVVNVLTRYKGIGEWTANIFLIFSLGRIDALPKNDLGLWRALGKTYGITLNDSNAFEKITSRWKPYRTVGCWYMWKSLNFKNIRQQ